jgi:hypothetical protein
MLTNKISTSKTRFSKEAKLRGRTESVGMGDTLLYWTRNIITSGTIRKERE